MDAREYLEQANRLDLRIKSRIKEREELMELITSLTSPQLGDKVMSSSSGDPQFVKQLEKIWSLDSEINSEIDLLVDLKMQVNEVLNNLKNTNHQLVLRNRYINGYSLEEIARLMNLGRRTVWRWHKDALDQVKLPENPVII